MDNQNLYEDYEDYQENEESKLTTVALILGIASILLFPGGVPADCYNPLIDLIANIHIVN